MIFYLLNLSTPSSVSFKDTSTPDLYTLSLHDALPIFVANTLKLHPKGPLTSSTTQTPPGCNGHKRGSPHLRRPDQCLRHKHTAALQRCPRATTRSAPSRARRALHGDSYIQCTTRSDERGQRAARPGTDERCELPG